MENILIILLVFTIFSCSANAKVEETEVTETEESTPTEEVINVYNYDNIPYESLKEYSESFNKNSAWSFSGDGSFNSELNKKTIHINSGEVSLNSASMMLKNGNHILSFSSNVGGNIKVYSSDGVYLDTSFEPGSISLSFFINQTNYETVVSFSFNGDNSDVVIDDFNIDSNNRKYGALINQVTYLDNLEKQVVFRSNPGNYFGVYNSNDELVYVGDTSEAIYENDTDEWLYKGFFGDLKDSGSYYIKSEFGCYSNVFSISEGYDSLLSDALNAIYVQRCGYQTDGVLGHPECHTSDSKVFSFTDETYINTTGGWHDAGDYGKYTIVENKVIADLLFSYMYGKNSDSALIDEIEFGLDYILKLQKDDGSVYNKVVSKSFAGFVSPELDNKETYLLYTWTSCTASFAGITGLAYEAFKDSNPDLASRCLEAFNKAITFLYDNQSASNRTNPDDFNVGTYYVDDESDERLFAYALAYKLTLDDKYMDLCKQILNSGVDKSDRVANCRVYAYTILLDSLKYNSDLYNTVKDALENECNSLCDGSANNVYAYPYASYLWGSNAHVVEAINELLLGSRYLKDERYVTKASEMINYILGLNTLNMSFIWGYGYSYPSGIHSRLAYSKGQNMIKGAMCNGVDQYLSDGVIGNYFNEESPIGTRFVDNSDSYSNVEPAINYNSALYLSLSLLEYANNNSLQ